MAKSKLLMLILVMLVVGLTLPVNAEDKGVKIGGHVKGVTFDTSWGTSEVNGVDYTDTSNNGFGFSSHAFIFYVSKDISDNVSVHVSPDFGNARAGATPKLGRQIGQQKNSTAGNNPSYSFYEHYLKVNIPDHKLELRAGYINIPFTQDYGKELFWHEQYHGGKATLYAGSWHDTGIELYRNYELSSMSLPVYLYFLNGSGGTSYLDNNADKTILLHLEPEFTGSLAGLKTSISYGSGKWGDQKYDADSTSGNLSQAPTGQQDAGYTRTSLGASYAYQKWSFRAETMGGKWEKYFNYGTATEADQKKNGYYFKVFYQLIPDKLRGMVAYDYYKADTSDTVAETYKTTTLGLTYELASATTLIIQYDMADWSNDETPSATAEDSLDFNRLVMGFRVTF